MSFWHFALKKKKVGATWFSCTIVVMPTFNILLILDSLKAPQPKVYDMFKLSLCDISEATTDAASPDCTCILITPGGEYVVEAKAKDYIAKYKKIMKANLPSKASKAAGKGTEKQAVVLGGAIPAAWGAPAGWGAPPNKP